MSTCILSPPADILSLLDLWDELLLIILRKVARHHSASLANRRLCSIIQQSLPHHRLSVPLTPLSQSAVIHVPRNSFLLIQRCGCLIFSNSPSSQLTPTMKEHLSLFHHGSAPVQGSRYWMEHRRLSKYPHAQNSRLGSIRKCDRQHLKEILKVLGLTREYRGCVQNKQAVEATRWMSRQRLRVRNYNLCSVKKSHSDNKTKGVDTLCTATVYEGLVKKYMKAWSRST